MKRIYILFVFIIALCVLTSCGGGSNKLSNGLQFNTFADGTAFVTAMGDCTDTEIVIPSRTPLGMKIVGIGSGAFKGKDIESVIIPEGVVYIGDEAFLECENLKSVSFPESLERIGKRAFASSAIESITLPDSVTQIGNEAFYKSKLMNARLGNGEMTIGRGAFSKCESLTVLQLSPNTVSLDIDSIESPGIVELLIPGAIGVVPSKMFSEFKALQKVEIAEGITTIEKEAFYGCQLLMEVKLPSTLESIGESAFSGCRSLHKITLNDNLKSIGEKAFMDCTVLPEMKIPNTVETIGEAAFLGCTALKSFSFPK